MRRAIFAAWAVLAVTATAAPAFGQTAPVVFFDIAGPDLAKQRAFYNAVFGWEIAPGGAFTVKAAPQLSATLREEKAPGKPVETLIYVGVPDVTATLAKVTANGGAVVYPRMEVPGVVVLGLFTDPVGARMGLVEMNGDKAKVP
jgi:uncharacterized protein